MEPRWTHGNKGGVGTAYSAASKIWFTLFGGIVTEVYFPTVDRPQMRDLQYLITDGKSFFHEEMRDMKSSVERLSDYALGFRCTNVDPGGRYTITKDVISDPYLPCLLQHTHLTGSDEAFLKTLRMFALCAPHLEVGGGGNNGYVTTVNGAQILMARKEGIWLAMLASIPFSRTSCGYVGKSDGWTDLHENFRMDCEFEQATNGNIALTGELDLSKAREFTLAVAFGPSEHRAITNLLQSLGVPFSDHLTQYKQQWAAAAAHCQPLQKSSFDGGNLYHSSYSVVLAHEDKAFPGAIIASLAIPWGEAKGDEDQGAYHLVWTRDMVNSATALLAAGDKATPVRALIFLAVSQHEDGGFAQNFWVNGNPYWTGIQLDEVAFPIMLARRLWSEKALEEFDPYLSVLKGAAYLIRHGPVTQQERWEEASGYSPSTLASNIAALICASLFFHERGDEETALFTEQYADYLESHIEDWTVTSKGSLHPGIAKYYMRILPEEVGAANPAEGKEERILTIKNLPPGQQNQFPAKDVVDGGFLELVRYGIRAADDPIIVNYELAAGRGAETYIKAMEKFASTTGLLPEQVWDEADKPAAFMFRGKPSGSAMPLLWAHAEYIKLLRSASEGRVYDWIPEVGRRYVTDRQKRQAMEVWKLDRQIRFMPKGAILRIHGKEQFRLRWSNDDWKTQNDSESKANALQVDFVDLPVEISVNPGTRIEFTFFWMKSGQWEGRNFAVSVQ